jgi:hypothetical protein
MNCFEARNEFVAFWRKTLDNERQTRLLAHLRICAGCDRSFRSFALTAPVLYSASEPDWNAELARPSSGSVSSDFRSGSPVAQNRSAMSPWSRLLPAFVMAAAAVIAIYFAVPPRMTFEDAIAAGTGNTEVASYPPAESSFGLELIAQGTTPTDVGDE